MVNSLSVFFPAYNEEGNIKKTVERAVEVLESLNIEWEIVIVDDGSKDKTGEIADELALKNPKIRVVHQANGGYGEAIKSGLYNSKLEWIAFTDSDGQFDFSDISKLIEKSDEADLVVGYRMDRKDPVIRKINGWGWTTINNILFGLNLRDIDCAFKLINKKVIGKISKLEAKRGAMISPELLAKAKKSGFKIIEVGVHHYPRLEGNSTGASLKVIINSFRDLFRLWWKIK